MKEKNKRDLKLRWILYILTFLTLALENEKKLLLICKTSLKHSHFHMNKLILANARCTFHSHQIQRIDRDQRIAKNKEKITM